MGFLIGMTHALEADHLAAISTMMSDSKGSKKRLAFRGAAWGLGHTVTLSAICLAVILFGATLTDRIAAVLEFGVGVMLIILGLDVYRRFRKKKLHFHGHQHDGKPTHFHVHSHKEAKVDHASDPHRHEHAYGFPLKAFAIGLVHGAAGSAGLLALAVAATQNIGSAIIYILAFGGGSILGMAALTYTVAWPLAWVEKGMNWMHTALTVSAAGLAIIIGSFILIETGPVAWGAG